MGVRMDLMALGIPATILLLAYGGARLLLVRAVRDLEPSVEAFGAEVQKALVRELAELGRRAAEGAARPPPPTTSAENPVAERLRAILVADALDVAAQWRDAEDTDRELTVVFRDDRGAPQTAKPDVFGDYLQGNCPLAWPTDEPLGSAGLILADGRLLLVAVAPRTEANGPTTFLLVGRTLSARRLADPSGSKAASGLAHYELRAVAPPHPRAPTTQIRRIAPILGEPLSVRMGGPWSLGRVPFETLTALRDVNGETVGILSVAIPPGVVLAARRALQWLAWGFAGLGLLTASAAFCARRWFVAKPLRRIRNAILEALDNPVAGGRLAWRRHDELGDVAHAVDELLDHCSTEARTRLEEKLQRRLKDEEVERQSLATKLRPHESLGRVVAGVAHDFNNLLSVIQGSVDRFQHGGNEAAPASEELVVINQAARHATDLVRQLQLYSGTADMTFEPVNLNAVLARTQSLLRASVPHAIALEFDESPDLPDVVADPTRLVQVVSNLVVNAAEAIGDQPGAIRVATRTVRRSELETFRYASAKPLTAEVYAQLTVSDTGRGISPYQIEHIQEPFFSTKGEGRGLGLSIVATILAAHDGALSISSRLGEGSVFSVVFPARVGASAAPQPPREAPPQATPAAEPPLVVLLVDDDSRIRKVTRLMLESLGCEVLEADQDSDARLQLQKHLGRIDGLLLDANVRGMDGVRALRVIRQRVPDLPTYLFSGHDEAQVRHVYAGLAFDGFIPKPFTREMMLGMLSCFRERRRILRPAVPPTS